MRLRRLDKNLFHQVLLSLERADSDCTRLALDADDLYEIWLCAESHAVAQFARYAQPCVVTRP